MDAIETAWRTATHDVGLVAWTAHARTGTLMQISAANGLLLGFPRREWRRPGFWMSRVLPDDRSFVFGQFSAVVSGASVPPWDVRVLDVDDSLRWIRTSASRVDGYDGLIVAGVHLDVTPEHRAVEAAAARPRDRMVQLYRAVWDSIPASAVAVDAMGTVVEGNAGWLANAQALGATHGFAGQPIYDVLQHAFMLDDPDATRLSDRLRDLLDGRSAEFVVEFGSRASLTGERWMRVQVLPFHPPERGAILIQWDITDVKHSEILIQDARDRLAHAQRVATMNTLATAIAHGLNQPLTAVVASAYTARRLIPEASRAELEPIINDIVASASVAASVIRRARAMTGRDSGLREPLSLNEIVAEVCGLVASDFVIHQVALATELAVGLPPIVGDRVELGQVLVNLLLNSIEALQNTPKERRSVTIVTAQTVGGDVELTVTDTGQGLPGDVGERIFDAFTSTKRGAAGLGLAVARLIVEAHNGHLTAATSSTGGAAFRVTLPRLNSEDVPDVRERVGSLVSHAVGDRR